MMTIHQISMSKGIIHAWTIYNVLIIESCGSRDMCSGFISAGTQLMLHNPSSVMALSVIVDSSGIIQLSGIDWVVRLCICV
jgi:hypothetical protein